MKTTVTREQIYRAMMARETFCNIAAPRRDGYPSIDAFLAASDAWIERVDEARTKALEAYAVILNTLIDDCGLSVTAARGEGA